MYYKEIIYLTGFRGMDRTGNTGYAKVEIRDEDATFSLTLRNLPISADGTYAVRVLDQGGWKELRKVTIRGGSAGESWSTREVRQVQRIEILLPQGFRIEGVSRIAEPEEPEKEPQSTAKVQRIAEPEEPEKELQSTAKVQSSTEPEEPEKEPQSTAKAQSSTEPEVPEKQLEHTAKPQSSTKPQSIIAPEELHEIKEDKWEQLLHTYEVIHPYGDERAYVRLEPKDFVIMQAKYQHLVNNSFLLHGFYNYRYLILGKEKEDLFYLGVPGVYYDREKMVALMFGFEAFECEGGKAHPGGFGYYLRRVEL